MRGLLILLAVLAASALADKIPSPGERDGQVHGTSGADFLAWDSRNAEWRSPVDFWRAFAARERGRNWGEGVDFPPYSEVNEHDTFLAQTANGPCLMYFFHTRWRRANDVWRWGPEFNRFGGCPTVFD